VSNWRQVTLGQLASIKHGYAFKSKHFSDEPTTDVLFTRANFAIGGGFRLDKPKYYDGPIPKAFVLEAGEIMVVLTDLSRDGDLLGYPARVPARTDIRLLHNQRVGKVIVDPDAGVDRDFLYYVLCTDRYRRHVLATASQTTVRDTAPSRLEAFEFVLPPPEIQHDRGRSLRLIDEKISVNDQVGQLLDRIVKASFRSRSEGSDRTVWPICPLGDLVDMVKDVERTTEADPDSRYIGLDQMPRGTTILGNSAPRSTVSGPTSRFETGDILFGKLRPYFKKIGVALWDGSCSTEILVLRPKDNAHFALVIGHLSSQEFIDYCVGVSKGTRMPRAEWAEVSKYLIATPPDDDRAWSAAIQAVYALVETVTRESAVLRLIREELVSRLLDVPAECDPRVDVAA
jgi:type I restriction enzyme S subunit